MPDWADWEPGTAGAWDPKPPAAAAPTADVAPSPAAAAATAQQAAQAPRYLSPQEQQAIVSSIGGHSGWFVVGGAAVPETKLGTNLAGQSVNVPTGAYTITLSDGKGHTEPNVKVTPGNPDASGNPTWIPGGTPTDLPKPTDTPAAQGTEVAGQGVWGPDPNNPTGAWIQKVAATPEQRAAAVIAIQKTLTDIGYTAAQAKAVADKTPAEITQILASAGASAAQTTKTLQDVQQAQALQPGVIAQQAATLAGTTATTGQTLAQTGYTGAQTGQVLSATQIAQQKAGPEIAGIEATTEAQKASAQANLTNAQRTQQQIAQGNAPTVENIAATNPYIYQRDPGSGQLTPSFNPGYQPTTQAEVAARVAQLQQMASSQRDALMTKQQSGAITADQAQQQFQAWWDQNVEPQKAALDTAQRSAQLAEEQKTQEANRAAYATAQQAGQTAVTAQQALLPYMVGPGFGAALNNIQGAYASGKAPGNIDIGSAVSFQLPDMQALAEQATNQALAHISPMAAQNMNQTHGQNAMPQMGQQASPMASQDMSQALNRSTYAPTTTVAPDGTVTVSHAQQPQAQPQPAFAQPNYQGLAQGNQQPAYPGLAQGGAAPPLLPYRPLSQTLAPGQLS